MVENPKKASAIRLRCSGKSLSEISEILKISKSSASVWVRQVKMKKKALAILEERNSIARRKAAKTRSRSSTVSREVLREAGRIAAEKADLLHLKGCMLYWAEGDKEKRSIRFSNSSPEMILLFLKFLQACLGVNGKQISYRIHLYDDVFSVEEVENFWAGVIGIPEAKAHKSVVNPYTEFSISKSKRKGKLPMGTCHLIVHGVRYIQHIYGALEVYGGVVIDPP